MKGRAQVFLHGSGIDTRKSVYPVDSRILSKRFVAALLELSVIVPELLSLPSALPAKDLER